MIQTRHHQPNKLLASLLEPWRNSIQNPAKAQEIVLNRFLKDYSQTEYGQLYGAAKIDTIDDYRRVFPAVSYETLKPWINRVMHGDVNSLLCEEPIGWAITRGTTKGESKFIPMTPTDMRQRIAAGRAVMNYVHSKDTLNLSEGINLNLNFPSVVGKVNVGGREIDYGYSSGIYAKHVSKFTPIESVPSQDEIDALGGGKTVSDWDRRFDLAKRLCEGRNVTLVGGVCQTALLFGRYLKRQYRCYPKDLWRTKLMTLGSTPGINTKHRTTLKAFYGPVDIREIYGATEGIFGQQRDHYRAWVPNYDLFFFEVETRSGVKMLHQMNPLERGSLIVSTPTLPRYRIGDIILAFQAPYFRCIGRERWWTTLKYVWEELINLNFNQL